MAQALQISCLPPELLEEIFLDVCQDINDYNFEQSAKEWTTARTFSPNYDSPASPFSISHVNRQWRGITINLPRLWTHLRIVEPHREGISQLAKEWIGRAGSLPLHLSLHSQVECPAATKTILNFYFDSIHRCISFELDMSRCDDLVGMRWPNQHRLKFVKIRMQSLIRHNWNFFTNFFLRSGTLSSLIWDIPKISFSNANISQPWTSLTELALLRFNYSTSEWDFIKSNCTSLVKLIISINMTWLSTGPRKLMTLPQLTSLSVECPLTLFEYLILPSLHELEIIADHLVSFTSVVGMLERSGSTLKTLKLNIRGQMATYNEALFAQALTLGCFQGLKELKGRGHVLWSATWDILNARVRVLEDGESSGAHIDTMESVGASRSMYRYLPYLDKISLM